MPVSRAKKFFTLEHFAVVGASADQSKFGNKVLRCYKEKGMPVTAVNTRAQQPIEDTPTVASLTAFAAIATTTSTIPITNVGVSIITPPAATRAVIEEGVSLGFTNFFLQPGTTDASVKAYMRQLEGNSKEVINFIEGCVLVELGIVGNPGEDF